MYMNNFYFVIYDKCYIKVFYNDIIRNVLELVKDDFCIEGY